MRRVWKPIGLFELMDIDFGFYMVKFEQDRDQIKIGRKILNEGLWLLFDHYLTFQEWTSDFDSSLLLTRCMCGFAFLSSTWFTIMSVFSRLIGTPGKVEIDPFKPKDFVAGMMAACGVCRVAFNLFKVGQK